MNENISDVDLEEVEGTLIYLDPRQRELLLLAKVRVLKDKLENKK